MIITKLTQTKRGRFAISIDEIYTASVDAFTVSDFHLCEGMSIDEDTLAQVISCSDGRRAQETALRLLSYRSHFKKELLQKLSRQNGDDAAQAAADRMEELGIVNDRGFAERFAEEMFNVKLYGERRVRYELSQRGVGADIIDEVLEDIPDPSEQIEKLLTGKLRNIPRDAKGRKRIADRLYALGYDWDDVKLAMNNEQ